MKNLFTKMVLVAVAAMGMLACQNEPETVVSGNDNAQKTTIEVIADLENTRSAFGNKGADGAYASVWQGGEQVKAAFIEEENYYGRLYYSSNKSDVTTVSTSGSVANFSLTFSSLSATSGTMLIASPAGSVDFETGGYDVMPGFVVTIPTEQTPLAASVDPAAHILTATYTGSFANAIKPEWEHAAAYAKMTLKNFNAEIDNVVVTIDSKSYILNPDNVEGNVFWFACEANEAPSTVKVAVNTTDEKAYTKTLDLTAGNGQGLPFKKGNVAEFSVNMDGVDAGAVDKPLTADIIFTNVEWKSSYFNFTGDGGVYLRLYLNAEDRPNNNSIAVGTYETYEYRQSNPQQGNFSVDRYSYDGLRDKYGSSSYTSATGSKLEVSIVNNQYYIIITLNSLDKIRTYGYKGLPEGWVIPGGGEEPDPDPDPVQLAAPTNLSATATTNTATISWDAVANASSYDVTVGITKKNVTDLTATFDGLTPDATYEVSVVAVGDGTNYTNSTEATTTVKTLASATPEPEPEPDGAIVFSSCTYLENVYGMLKHYKFVSADGQNVIHVFMNSNNSGTATAYIPVGDYTNGSMNNAAQYSTYFNMDCNVGDVAITDTKINGEVFANGISTAAANTMKVTEAANNGNHVIEFVIKGTTFRFTGTIQ